ncbi:DUF6134 family protein [Siccirubricoccus sp. KC 17139]|uniref:DUF6134 family protein n=1 Tax=Siccirubricoccus soli TaxID=2899147 RepID=A0ABT1D304_9PROT|nr:DUF6134 family protein [Siccirubricoccus soli]MCP2682435.1 DUF6134 family protein [Siccirubricoccus soli]
MRRRSLLAAPLLWPALRPAALRALPAGLRFRIMREGSAIGEHRVSFAETGGRLTALTEVAIQVKLMGITVFRFQHRFEEAWAGGRLRFCTSRLERQGRVTEMAAREEGGALLVQGPESALRLPAEAAPLSWWDPARFDGRPLFANDTGKLLRLQVARTPLPGGGVRCRVSGEEESAASYGPDGTWLDWTHKAEDGSTVTYERLG